MQATARFDARSSPTPSMIPFQFGASERRLFGIYQPGTAAGTTAVLMCYPFGQEGMRAHRMFRVLADRLNRIGVSVLRFDAYGTGDAAGDDEDGELEGWQRDVLAAHEELLNRSSAQRICWMGVRLGATVALRASAQAGASVQRLVLWDPVVDGSAYLGMLRDKHVAALEAAFTFPDRDWRRRLEADPTAFIDEALGFGLSPILRRQLLEIDLDSLSLPQKTDTHVIADPSDAPVRTWLQRSGAARTNIKLFPLDYALDWTAAGAMNTALVPGNALQRLLASLGGPA